MDSASRLAADLRLLLDLTGQIQAQIEEGNWLGATELDIERQAVLQRVCSALQPNACPPEVLQALGEMVKLNDAMVASVERRQDVILRDAQVIGVGRRAVAAYNAV